MRESLHSVFLPLTSAADVVVAELGVRVPVGIPVADSDVTGTFCW